MLFVWVALWSIVGILFSPQSSMLGPDDSGLGMPYRVPVLSFLYCWSSTGVEPLSGTDPTTARPSRRLPLETVWGWFAIPRYHSMLLYSPPGRFVHFAPNQSCKMTDELPKIMRSCVSAVQQDHFHASSGTLLCDATFRALPNTLHSQVAAYSVDRMYCSPYPLPAYTTLNVAVVLYSMCFCIPAVPSKKRRPTKTVI